MNGYDKTNCCLNCRSALWRCLVLPPSPRLRRASVGVRQLLVTDHWPLITVAPGGHNQRRTAKLAWYHDKMGLVKP